MQYNLQLHLDRYKDNIPLQKLLKNLVEYIDSKLNVNIKYNSTYIRFDFPAGKKWAWIDTLENRDAFRLRFHDLDEKGEEDFHELYGYNRDQVELESKEGNDFSTVLIKDVVNIYEPDFYAFLNRKYLEYKKYYEEGINIRKVKASFFDVLGDEDSLGHYRKAYIILLLKGFFELSHQDGKINFDSIAEYFKGFYFDRKNKGFQVEDDPDDRIGKIEQSTLEDIKYIIKSNPLNTKTLEGRLKLIDQNIAMNEYLWLELSRNDIEHIRYVLNKQLAKYFNERVDGDSMAIPDVDRDKIKQAIEYYDENLRDTEDWTGFTSKKNYKYAIRYNGNLYPVKKIISIATDAHVSTFSGGEEANNYLKARDFEIVELDQVKLEPLKSGLKELVDNYLEARSHQEFAGHELGDLVRHNLPEIINQYLLRFNIDHGHYEIKGSIGQGNWAKVPWLAIMNKDITTTTQEGIYVVYLFSKDMERVYLTFMQGVTKTSKEELISTRNELRENLDLSLFTIDNEINLADDGLGKDYELSTICYKKYKTSDFEHESVINEGILVNDLKAIMDVYQEYKDKYIGRDINQQFVMKKKLDWSSFNWGFTIPGEYHQTFYNCINEELVPGSTQDIILKNNNNDYTASIRNVNRDASSETLQIRYDGINELRDLLINKFNQSYNYIVEERKKKNKDGSTRPHVEVPDDRAEYINIYYSGIPNQFSLEFLPNTEDEKTPREVIDSINNYIPSKGFTYPPGLIENFYLSLKTKPFVLLAGVSGTGKTKLVKLFAEAIGCTDSNGRFKLISVRPDWSDSSDLLGYKDIKGKFQPGPMINILKKAEADPDNVYFVCLDEMNLARVEYYFSDFLSIMETRRKNEEGRVATGYLLEEQDFARNEDKEEYAELMIPDNLYIVGTVNMDETTHPFSKKVLDRANTIEFSEINLLDYRLSDFDVENQLDSGRVSNEFLKADYLTLNNCSSADEDIILEVVENLQQVNDILEQASLQVGYRVRDEICFYMIYNQHEGLLEKEQAFDFQLMQKVLPRIQGSSRSIKSVLIQLFNFATGEDLSVNEGEVGNEASKLIEVFKKNENNAGIKYPLSAEKIATMIKRIEEDGFTAYWL